MTEKTAQYNVVLNKVKETQLKLGLKNYQELAEVMNIKHDTLKQWAGNKNHPEWFPSYCDALVENKKMKQVLSKLSEGVRALINFDDEKKPF